MRIRTRFLILFGSLGDDSHAGPRIRSDHPPSLLLNHNRSHCLPVQLFRSVFYSFATISFFIFCLFAWLGHCTLRSAASLSSCSADLSMCVLTFSNRQLYLHSPPFVAFDLVVTSLSISLSLLVQLCCGLFLHFSLPRECCATLSFFFFYFIASLTAAASDLVHLILFVQIEPSLSSSLSSSHSVAIVFDWRHDRFNTNHFNVSLNSSDK